MGSTWCEELCITRATDALSNRGAFDRFKMNDASYESSDAPSCDLMSVNAL